MKKLFILLLAVVSASALFFSCTVKEINEPVDERIPDGYVAVDFSASIEAVKSDIDADGHTVWSAGDEIAVFWEDGQGTASLTGGAGTPNGVFHALVPEGKTAQYAVYPAAAAAGVSESTVSVVIPAEQSGSFAAGNIAVAAVDGGNALEFFNVNAFLSVQVTGNDITKIVVTSVAGTPLAGTQSVLFGSQGPALESCSASESSVTMAVDGAGIYYLSVLSEQIHSSGLVLQYYKGEQVSGTYMLNKSVTTHRSRGLAFGAFEPDGNYYVTVDGAGKKNGLSWENAFSAAQLWNKLTLTGEETDAEKAARVAAIDGATFHLGAGTYDFGDSPLISFNEETAVVLNFIGGYPAAGGEQDLALYRADFTGNDAHAALRVNGKMEVHFEGIGFVHALLTSDEKGALDLNGDPAQEGWSVSATLRYCYIGNNTNASYAASPSDDHNQGAGLRLKSVSSFTADHVTIENNTAYAAAGAFIRNTQAYFTDCTFRNNIAYNKAGAVYTTGDSNESVSADFTRCVFEDNESKTYQGAALLQNKGTNSFTDCTFTNNDSVDSGASGEDIGYGGAINVVSGDLTIEGGSFSGNDGLWGGAIMYGASNTLSITGTTFSDNTATDGGALELGKGSAVITNCIFTGNEALHDDINRSEGNGYGGAIDCYSKTNLTVEGGSFSGNVAWRGGAMCINTSGSASVSGVTFTGNGSADYTRAGGAIYSKQNLTITDCTFGGANEADGNKAKFGGAINHVKKDGNYGLVSLYGGVFQNNVANECGGAICEESGMNIDRYEGEGTLFLNNKVTAETAADCGGGALWAETYSQSNNKNVKVKYAVFKGNEAFSGGACLVYGKNSGLYLADCTFGGENDGDGNYARGNSGNGGGGSLYMDKKSYSTFTRCTITGDHAKRWGGSVFANTDGGNFIAEGCTFTGCYSSNGWGGAICSYKGKMSELKISGGAFIGCHSNSGGAVLSRLTEGNLVFTDYNNEGALFQGNYADHATNVCHGGAIQLEGKCAVDDGGVSKVRVTIWKARFIGNYAGQGGAVYSDQAGKPDIYIDRCAFDGNYITKWWGPTIATDGVNRFHMNNCAIRNSYTANASPESQTGNQASWIAIYGNPTAFSISNSTIIGDPQFSSDGSSFTALPDGNGLINFGGSSTLYLINNIIVPNTETVAAVRGDVGTEAVDMLYNQYSSVANVVSADSGGNVSGLTASSFDGLKWADNCWKWNGTIGGSAPDGITASVVLDRLNTINAAYVSWIADPDYYYDYFGTNRGEGSAQWWPGAYQPASN